MTDDPTPAEVLADFPGESHYLGLARLERLTAAGYKVVKIEPEVEPEVEPQTLADRLAECAEVFADTRMGDLLIEAVEALREKDAEIGRLKNHHEATIAQTDRVLREKDAKMEAEYERGWQNGLAYGETRHR